ncbi:hypothetical protein D5R40_34030 [Okeania hirsuta]|uniref:Uncharacterized protein n=1 Tax=Okeania hirsuta TaxID=1458930 RepID=A0A3N6NGG3_9CYAN|nr:hypothetical protein D5R40_34030 [Okeania hirsuta]
MPSIPVAVGCASGIDQLVRQAFPQARVFTAASQHPGALAARSGQLVRFIATSGGCLLVFPAGPCPRAVRVSRVSRVTAPAVGVLVHGSFRLPVLVCALCACGSCRLGRGHLRLIQWQQGASAQQAGCRWFGRALSLSSCIVSSIASGLPFRGTLGRAGLATVFWTLHARCFPPAQC